MKKILLSFLFVIMCMFPTFAWTDDDEGSMLKGTYHVSGNQNCVWASGDGFGENFVLPNGGSTSSMTFQGEYVFNGDGTGHRFINWLVVSHTSIQPGQRPINYGTSEADFTYTEKQGGTFEMTSDIATVEKAFGLAQTIDGYGTNKVILEAGNKTFTSTDTSPTIETIIRADGRVYERICNRTRIGIKLTGNNKND